ncbi:MAG: hypothetical protein QM752_06360 [Gammaproteobacteria bacterium]
MKGSRVSLCYYPTTIILVDDQENYLDGLKMGLDDKLLCQYYTDPTKLVNFLKNYKPDPFINRCVTFDEDSAQANLIVSQVSLRDIYSEIYNQNRFKQISLLVADYAMPGYNGLECCDAVRDKFIKKLLLTGEAQNDLAVKAFNERRIHQFIQKSTPNLMPVLNKAIEDLLLSYFLELSDYLRGAIEANINQPMLTLLDDPVFAEFFYSICEDKNIVEFYLLDNQGSFLLLNDKAEPTWLLMKDEIEMSSLTDFSEVEEAPEEIQMALRTRQKFPYFHTEEDTKTPPAEWEKYMHPATSLLGGQQTYYYCLLSGNLFGIDLNSITSLKEYLKNLEDE